MFDAYSAWTWEEELSRSERRNRTDFGMDLRAALAPKGVRYGQKRDPHDGKRRRGWWGVTLRHDSGTADGPT